MFGLAIYIMRCTSTFLEWPISKILFLDLLLTNRASCIEYFIKYLTIAKHLIVVIAGTNTTIDLK